VSIEEGVRLFAELSASKKDHPASMVWIDVVSPGEAEAVLLRDRLGMHPLAVEDCIRGRQRPKVDRYPGYFFLVLYATRINEERRRMALHEIHIFLGERFIITVHDRKIPQVGEVVARWRAYPSKLADTGAVGHALLDSIVDGYFPVLDHFSGRVEAVEDSMFTDSDSDRMQNVLSLRRELTIFRRVVAPQRDVLTALLRRDLPFLRADLVPYYQDVHDHLIRVTEEIDALRELLAAAADAYLSSVSNRLNQTMRLMAAWSIVLMAMAWIASVYGMNFLRMPELAWRYGYAWAMGAMLTLGAGILYYFRRRGWL
jgi:magnesium transporter